MVSVRKALIGKGREHIVAALKGLAINHALLRVDATATATKQQKQQQGAGREDLHHGGASVASIDTMEVELSDEEDTIEGRVASTTSRVPGTVPVGNMR